MFLPHRCKLGPVQPDGWQYCTKCGIGQKPRPAPCQCQKEVIRKDVYQMYGNTVIYTNRCMICGEITSTTIRPLETFKTS
jgi:hypothetical protein